MDDRALDLRLPPCKRCGRRLHIHEVRHAMFAELRDGTAKEHRVSLCLCSRVDASWTGCIICTRLASEWCVVTPENMLVFACALHVAEMAAKLRDRLTDVEPPVVPTCKLAVYTCGCCGRHAWHSPKWCADCLRVHYCSRVCQLQAWPEHRGPCLIWRRSITGQ
jgi:hypothetical protein